MLSVRRLIPAVAAVIVLTGCAATQVALENKDLDVQLQASQTVFLQPVAADKKTVWIDVKNTSATDLSLAGLPALVTARGYTLVQDPDAATYWLQVNVLYVGKAAIAAIRDAVAAGFGGPALGAAVGAAVGSTTSGFKGFVVGSDVGGLVGGIAELVSGSLVKKVTYTALADVQITERVPEGTPQPVAPAPAPPATITQTTSSPQPGQVGLPVSSTTVASVAPLAPTGRQAHRTRMAAIATKVNLELPAAMPALTDTLLKSIAGVL